MRLRVPFIFLLIFSLYFSLLSKAASDLQCATTSKTQTTYYRFSKNSQDLLELEKIAKSYLQNNDEFMTMALGSVSKFYNLILKTPNQEYFILSKQEKTLKANIENFKEVLELIEKDQYQEITALKEKTDELSAANDYVKMQATPLINNQDSLKKNKKSLAELFKQKIIFYQKLLDRIQEERMSSCSNNICSSDIRHLIRSVAGYLLLTDSQFNLIVGNQQQPPCGMSLYEYTAIQVYSVDGYSSINKALRGSHTDPLYQDIYPIIQLIDQGLDKLAPYQGLVKRGSDLPENVLKKHCLGCIVTYKAFTSTSTRDSFTEGYQFIIKSESGKYIAPISINRAEEEVLFKDNTRFRVVDIKPVIINDKNTLIFTMEEVP